MKIYDIVIFNNALDYGRVARKLASASFLRLYRALKPEAL